MGENNGLNQLGELHNAVHIIKNAILNSQERALGLINQEQLALYYGIGRFISVNTRNKNWGKGFIEALSEQLRKELPGLRGFSAPSLRKMRTFYEEWKSLLIFRSLKRTNWQRTNQIRSLKRMNYPSFILM